MRPRHILTGILTGLPIVVPIAVLMARWGKFDWGILALMTLSAMPFGIWAARGAAFREKYPDFEMRDFQRRLRGW